MTLDEYIHKNINRSFSWGDFDCLRFVGYYLKDVKSFEPIPLDKYNYNTEIGAMRCLVSISRDFGVTDFLGVMDKMFHRVPTYSDGYIVARPADKGWYQYGIIHKGSPVFVSERGLEYFRFNDNDKYWRI